MKQQKYDADNAHNLNKEQQREELHKQMGKIIRHSDMTEENMITDIENSESKKEPILPVNAKDNEFKSDEEDQKNEKEEKVDKKPINSEDQTHHNRKQNRITLTMAEIKHIYSEEVEKQEESDKVSLLAKCLKYITMPIQISAMCLIPNVDKEKIDEWYCPIIPFTSIIGLLTIMKSKHI